MNKLIETLAMGLLAVLTAATTAIITQQQTVYASSLKGECSTIPASDPELEGWQIETCGNGDQTWISPKGTRCAYTAESGNMACDDMVSKGIPIN